MEPYVRGIREEMLTIESKGTRGENGRSMDTARADTARPPKASVDGMFEARKGPGAAEASDGTNGQEKLDCKVRTSATK